ncbi:MAG: ATP-binding protein [Syntrophomonadaceae bacterium]|nr:ATP-binding protein [Syntrophomonadaceae bacterium]
MGKLAPEELRKTCDASQFAFETTATLQALEGVIGQERALRALRFGLDIKNQGYNIYLAGFLGTGKTTLAKELVEKKAAGEPCPPDWCYVYNFRDPDCPRALELPAGKGKVLVHEMEDLVTELRTAIPKAFESQHFEMLKGQILGTFFEETNRMYHRLEEIAQAEGFTIQRTPQGITTIPLKDGKPLEQEEFASLSEREKQDLMRRSKALQDKINSAMREYRELERAVRARIRVLEQETARRVMVPYFTELYANFRDNPGIVHYLEEVHRDMLQNPELFTEQQEEAQVPLLFFRRLDRRAALKRYRVNLLVDNSSGTCAPVVYEGNATFTNLFGAIEYESEFGVLATDFTKLRAGAVHRANGGYLILNVMDIFRNGFVWDGLKRVLKNQSVVIESPLKQFSVMSLETLEPEPIPVKLKVILIGEPMAYYLLYAYDEEFQKLFKVRADFDVEMARTSEHVQRYAEFIKSVCEEDGVRHFTREAVAEVVDFGTWLSGDQGKLTTQFNRLRDVIYEADLWASYEGAELVDRVHVRRAIKEKAYRSSMLEEKVLELINQGTLIIDVEGEAEGQINGLAVYAQGDYWFGKPSRITAKTFMGEKGVVNIEREIRMSGSIHTKGVLTLAGYLGAMYAQERPLSLSASLTFEQTYEGIEGDSASSAELYAILSSLAGVPIRQGIAVTGSVNQHGEIQPIGGVNQKIEGFFKVCRDKGLTGTQGVIIPRRNVNNLMLPEEIVDAVREGKFSIWAIDHVDEGIEILTGLPAGAREANGEFTPGSIHDRVNRRLAKWAELRAPAREPRVAGRVVRRRGTRARRVTR